MEPVLDETTERIYAQMPQHYQDQDALNDWQLKRYLGALLSTQDAVNTLITALQYINEGDGGSPDSTSALVNPNVADESWLTWLGQLFGLHINGQVTSNTRNEIVNASSFKSGTQASIIAAAQSVLVGSQKVQLVKHADENWPETHEPEGNAGPWDLLVMTLQSETLKNLLNSGLAKSLSPSAWDDDYQSYGYDPKQVYKQLVTQPGVYQNRAVAYTLRDPTWQASATISGGFGAGPFGSGTFGYAPNVTSQLRFTSHQGFPCTPGDSYQFLVSLGLKQDVLDQKIEAIGFEFFDGSNNQILATTETNYYPNPSHEYGLGPFTSSAGTNSTIALDGSHVHTGVNAIMVTDSATTGSTGNTSTQVSSTINTPSAMGCTVGSQVTLSCWVYIPSSNTATPAVLAIGGTGVNAATSNNLSNVRDNWTFVSVTTTISNASGTITATIYGGGVGGQKIWYDDFGLAVGTTPVDFNGDTPDPSSGQYTYSWVSTAGNSNSIQQSSTFSTPITITPTIENTSVVSHNYVESDQATYYGPYGDNSAGVTISNYGQYEGGNVVRATINALASTSNFGVFTVPTVGLGPIASGTQFTFSLDLFVDSSVNIDTLRVFFRDDTNGDSNAASFDFYTPPEINVTKARWHTPSWTATVNPGRTVTSAYIVVNSSVAQNQNAFIDTANWLIEDGDTVNPYFNGNTPADDTYTYQWEGIANASVTDKVLTSVAQENIVDMVQYSTRFTAPAGAVTAKVFIDCDGFDGKDTFYIAQPAVREEEDETWVPENADPVAAIIAKNAKPAGVVLHWAPLVSSWDEVTNYGTRTWDDLNNTWTYDEELTSDTDALDFPEDNSYPGSTIYPT